MFAIKKKILAYMLIIVLSAGTAGCSSRDIEEAADLFRETVQDTLNTGKENAEEDTKEIPEKEITQEQSAYYYGYSTLDEESRKVYRQLAAGIESFQEKIPIDPISQEQLEKVMRVLMADHPEYFWTDGTSSYTYQELPGGSIQNMEVQPNIRLPVRKPGICKTRLKLRQTSGSRGLPREILTSGSSMCMKP